MMIETTVIKSLKIRTYLNLVNIKLHIIYESCLNPLLLLISHLKKIITAFRKLLTNISTLTAIIPS